MIRLKFRFLPVIFSVITFIMYSCKEEEVALTAYGDVLIKSIQKGDSVFYGIYFYAYSWEKMTKVTVNREGDDKKITLDSLEYRFTFTHFPANDEYTSIKPARARYIFNVVFDNNEQYEASDILDSTAVLPPVIKDCYFNKEDDRLILDWEATKLAYKYIVVLENETNDIIFQSELLNADQTYLWITSNTYGWVTNKQPIGGEKYRVSVTAYQFEPVASSFDLQSIATAEGGTVEWDLNDE
jgi:hypothetical protein